MSTRHILGLLCMLLGGCAPAPPPSGGCIPNETAVCPCPGGALGAQTCVASGTGFGACVCPESPDAGADVGVDVVTPPDASPPPRCAAGTISVRFADGSTGCARLCTSDRECGGLLCEPLRDSSERVCVATPCGPGEYNVLLAGVETCLRLCGSADECPSRSCAMVADTMRSVCLPVEGGMTCPEGYSNCRGRCVDLATTGEHCGACDRNCASSQSCNRGRCEAPVDPCMGVSAAGRCVGASTVERCAVSTGSAQPQLQRLTCMPGEQCVASMDGARCGLIGECAPGQTQCENSSTLRRCEGGRWTRVNCPSGCEGSPLGGACLPGGIATRTLRFNLAYERRRPTADRRDWGPLEAVPAPPLDVFVYRGETLLDTTFVGNVSESVRGAVEVNVPADAQPGDVIQFAATTSTDGLLDYVVADPNLPAGEQDIRTEPTNPRVWSWSISVRDVAAGSTVTIRDADGAGAVHVYNALLDGFETTRTHYGRRGDRVVAWVGRNVSWSCGACFSPWPYRAFSQDFDAQLWINGDSGDQGYWSDAVNTHEVGHWAMSSFGVSPGEGGRHYLGVPTYPGQAWSEGFATYFSAALRGSSLYFDKQDGGFFWFDLSARAYGSGTAWQRPSASLPLTQRHDENDVAAVLYRLDPEGTSVLDALASPRMAGPTFARGYTRHTWETSEPGVFARVVNTGEPAPFLADLLDALRCASTSAAAVDAVTEPARHYPYSSSMPVCR